MATIYDAEPTAYIIKVAEALKQEEAIQPPPWAAFAKTGSHKERPPEDPEWWYKRSASVLRKLFLRGPIGVAKLRRHYGGKRNAGMGSEHYQRGSGNILRKVLQQLEQAGYVKQAEAPKKGRIITPKGESFLNKLAKEL